MLERLSQACRADRKEGGVGDLAYPLVSDLKREISSKYYVLTRDGVALRGLFIIDKEVRWHTWSSMFLIYRGCTLTTEQLEQAGTGTFHLGTSCLFRS